jgi:3alpha(or 20beta)-hydroxysteroid dehydrogenase
MVEVGATAAIGDCSTNAAARPLGDAALYVHLDATSEEDWTAAVAAALARFGKQPTPQIAG